MLAWAEIITLRAIALKLGQSIYHRSKKKAEIITLRAIALKLTALKVGVPEA